MYHIPARLSVFLTLPVVLTTALEAQGPFTVQEDLLAERDRRGAISWDLARPLTWTDFRAPPPTTVDREAALTESGFIYVLQCTQKTLAYGVLAVFQPDQSWVRVGVPTDSAQAGVLLHEQVHFNISELGARLLRAQMQDFAVPCSAADTAFARLAQSAFAHERALQARYDEETIHGTLAEEQARWTARIVAALDSLVSVGNPFTTRKY